MTRLTSKELYALFLESEWWILLSRRKRASVGRCERCGSKKRLQSHHRIYRENWFDTRLEDLEVLCGSCHSAHHGKLLRKHHKNKKVSKAMKRKRRMEKAMQDLAGGKPSWKAVCRARSFGMIDREKFEELRKAVGMDPESVKVQQKTKAQKRWERWHVGMYEGH